MGEDFEQARAAVENIARNPNATLAHFNHIATRYGAMRDLDNRAVRRVSRILASDSSRNGVLHLLDVGTGTGRYIDAIAVRLASKFSRESVVLGVDLNAAMLRRGVQPGEASRLPVRRLVARAEALPFREASFDALFCFNAIHHFDLAGFVRQASLILRPNGRLFIYTRTEEQNRETIWGRYFPGFLERETRLRTIGEIALTLRADGAFPNVRLQNIPWTLTTSLARLVDQVHARHYSTFSLFPPDELLVAADVFHRRVQQTFSDPMRLEISNPHLLVEAQRAT